MIVPEHVVQKPLDLVCKFGKVETIGLEKAQNTVSGPQWKIVVKTQKNRVLTECGQ